VDRNDGMKNERKHRVSEWDKVGSVQMDIWKEEGMSSDEKRSISSE
jgi:hypothetical protein